MLSVLWVAQTEGSYEGMLGKQIQKQSTGKCDFQGFGNYRGSHTRSLHINEAMIL